MSPRFRATAAFCAFALLVTACSGQAEGHFSDPGPIEWQECSREELAEANTGNTTFHCGTLKVPLDWEDPQGETIEIALLRVRSDDQENRIGSLLMNPGGPGGSGREIAAQAASFLPAEVLERFDIIGFDPRGVGASSPIRCADADFKDAMTALDSDPVDQAGFDAQARAAEKFAAGCRRKSASSDLLGDASATNKGVAEGLMSTVQTARDMDAVRAAVGDEKTSYLGYSYGTLLGYVYAQLFPEKIRAFVLDGAVDPTTSDVETSKGQAAGFESAFDDFAKWCTEQGDDCLLGPDIRTTTMRILDEVRNNPIPSTSGRTVTVGHVQTAITASMYTTEAWQILNEGLADLDNGESDRILFLADYYSGRQEDGSYDNSSDANTVVNCTDREENVTPEQVRDLQEQWRNEYPLFGGPLAITVLTCATWPEKAQNPYPLGTAEGAPPIVVVGTTGDPATPYENTEKLATMLGVGVVVTQVGEGHTSYPFTGQCLENAINDYLITRKTPEDGLRCE